MADAIVKKELSDPCFAPELSRGALVLPRGHGYGLERGSEFRVGPFVSGQSPTVCPPVTRGIQAISPGVDVVGFRVCCSKSCYLEDDLDLQLNLEGVLIGGAITYPCMLRFKDEVKSLLRKGLWDRRVLRAEHLDLPPYLHLFNPEHHIVTVVTGAPERGAFDFEILIARGSERFDKCDVYSWLPSGFFPLNVDFVNLVAYCSSKSFTPGENLIDQPLTSMEWVLFRVFTREQSAPPDGRKETEELMGTGLSRGIERLLQRSNVRTLGELVRCSEEALIKITGMKEGSIEAIKDWLMDRYSATLHDPSAPVGPMNSKAFFSGLRMARNTFKVMGNDLSGKGPIFLGLPGAVKEASRTQSVQREPLKKTAPPSESGDSGFPADQPPGRESSSVLLENSNLGTRCRRLLEGQGILTMEDLAKCSEPQLMSIKGFGRGSLKEVRDLLKNDKPLERS
jgi:hypothetical protein